MSEMKELALGYADAGLPVFPCRECDGEVTDYETGEIKTKREKTPLNSIGFKGAKTRGHIIDAWWRDHPNALVGIPTGEASGFWVLDIDVPSKEHDEDGRIWLDEMEELHGRLPETRYVVTANGGLHFLFTHVEGVGNKAAIAPGVDTRGDGGYIIAAGSVMADGREYKWGDDCQIIADAPEWLLDLVITPEPEARPVGKSNREYKPGGSGNNIYAQHCLQDECDNLASMGRGGRGAELNKAAFKLGSLVAGGDLSRSEVEAALYDAAVANGLVQTDGDREVRRKIARGLDTGARKPRNAPEPDFQPQSNIRLKDMKRLIANGERKAEEREEDGDEEDQEDEEEWAIKATPFNWVEPSTIPRREFVFGKHYIRKYVSVTVSPGGIGKTSNSIVEGLSMTSGKDLVGIKPDGRLNVWIFNAEDPMDELTRRVMAASLYFDLRPSDFEGRLFIDSGREQELVVATEDRRSGLKIIEPIVESVVKQIKRNKIDVMIVDPFVSTHGVNENDNGAIDTVTKLWAQIADETNCAIDIVHHLKKVGDERAATVEDARGAVSLIGAARSVRVFNVMNEAQAKQAELEKPDDRFSIFNINYGKANLSKRSNVLDWRKLEGQGLGNAVSLKRPQDHAPVVTAWKMPEPLAVIKMMNAEQINMMRLRMGNGQYKAKANAKNWAGEVIAEILALDIDDKDEKEKAARVLSAMLREGMLVKSKERDPARKGEMQDFIRPSKD